MFPDVELIYAGYIAWRGMVEEAALTPSAHAAIFHRFAWGLLDREHILGYPVPGRLRRPHARTPTLQLRLVPPGRRRDDARRDADRRRGPRPSEGIPPQLIRPEVIAALGRDAEARLPPVFAEIVRACAQPLFQPIGDLESPAMRRGRVALLGDAAFVARPHVAKGAIKAGHDAIELAAALAGGDCRGRPCALRRGAPPSERGGRRRVASARGLYRGRGQRAPIPSPSCARMAASRARIRTMAGSSSPSAKAGFG